MRDKEKVEVPVWSRIAGVDVLEKVSLESQGGGQKLGRLQLSQWGAVGSGNDAVGGCPQGPPNNMG